jgi:hypothetical protein
MKRVRLLRRRQLLFPTVWGWGVLVLLTLSAAYLCIRSVHSVLAPTRPVDAQALIVEGWLPDYALEAAVAEFKNGRYHFLIVTGGNLEQGLYFCGYNSYAEMGAVTIKKLGVDTSLIIPVKSPLVRKDRTYASAVAMKSWLAKSNPPVRSFNLFSLGCHSARSQLLFKKVLGQGYPVGIIACRDISYDERRWWHSSSGFREVVDETVAYLYAMVFYYLHIGKSIEEVPAP